MQLFSQKTAWLKNDFLKKKIRLKHQKHWSTPIKDPLHKTIISRGVIDGNFFGQHPSASRRACGKPMAPGNSFCVSRGTGTWRPSSPSPPTASSLTAAPVVPGGARWCSGRRSLRFQGFFGLGTPRAGWFLMGNPITMDDFCWLVMVCASKKRLNMATWMDNGTFWLGWLKWRNIALETTSCCYWFQFAS